MKNLCLPHFIGRWSAFTLILVLNLFVGHRLQAQLAKGADVSWITEMEAAGYVWYNDNGSQQDLLQILKAHGMNAIRLRVWVNPSGGWSNLNDMVAKAIRAKNAGMDLMLSIHYSDTWADPGNQTKPGAWNSLSFQGLMDQVWTYTRNVIITLQNNGVTPKWVQIGNETNDGMLWQDGRASSNMQNYAWLVNTGHNAVKDVNSSIQTIVHVSNGWDNGLFQWNMGGLISNGANFDIIGMSLYVEPGNWQSLNNQCIANLNDMRSRYGKQVMICEVGMRADQPEACRSFLSDLLGRVQNAGGLGVFYWEPQVYNGWKGYGLGAWQENGRPSVALDAFGGGSSPCTPTAITPYLRINGGSWQQASSASLAAGGSVQFGPQPVSGGSWSWSGPANFNAGTREVTINNIQTSQAGNYIATYTNSSGCQSNQTFAISVSGGGGGNNSTLRLQENATGFCSVQGSVDTNHSGYTGAGFANTNNATGAGITWRVTVGGGTYSLVWRFANGGGSNRSGSVLVNGTTVVSSLAFNSTGAWSSWNTTTAQVNLGSGTHTIRLQATGSGGLANIDYLEITGSGLQAISCAGARDGESGLEPDHDVPVVVYPNPTDGELMIEAGNTHIQSLRIFNALGQVVYQTSDVGERLKIDLAYQSNGLYFVELVMPHQVMVQRILKQ